MMHVISDLTRYLSLFIACKRSLKVECGDDSAKAL